MENHKKFKILSIDGGGIKGVFPASFLATIEDMDCNGGHIADYFDLIVGTSTGGIIALGLGLGLSAKEILEFYQMQGDKIFKGRGYFWESRYLTKVWQYFAPAYNPSNLKSALFEVFGRKILGDSKKRLVIPSLDLQRCKIHLYKTSHHERLKLDYLKPMVDVALATAAAPTYFPSHNITGTPYIDGGVWANNPSIYAIMEALFIIDIPKENVCVLSLGCTEEIKELKPSFGEGKLPWGLKVADLFTGAQSSSSQELSRLILRDNYKRISPPVPECRYSLDSTAQISSLAGLGENIAREESQHIQHFFKERAEEFKPIHTRREKCIV